MYVPVKINLSKANQKKLVNGGSLNLLPAQLNRGNNLMLHPLNYQKLKDKNLKDFQMSQGELLATAQRNGLQGSGIFSDIGNWLSDNSTAIFDTIGDVASFIPGIGPIASTVGRAAAKLITGKGI